MKTDLETAIKILAKKAASETIGPLSAQQYAQAANLANALMTLRLPAD